MAYEASPVHFDAPPVAEVALSIQTTPIAGLQTAHMSLFWAEHLRDDYPLAQDQPPVPPMIERFDDDSWAPTVMFGLATPGGRQWYLSQDQTRLIQLQNDRLVVNWRRLHGDIYPRYAVLRDEIARVDREWMRFVVDSGFRSAEVVQVEVTYINQVPLEGRLTHLSDIGELLSALRPAWPAQIGVLEAVQLEQRFLLTAPGNKPARMYLAVSPASLTDGSTGLTLNLVVRGAPSDTSTDGKLAWLDFAHNQIINSFADVTSEQMHRKWRKRDDRRHNS